MRLLLDTHVVIWAVLDPDRIPAASRRLLLAEETSLAFSVAVLWEITVKNAMRRSLGVDPFTLRSLLLENRYEELPILAEHALAVSHLAPLHGDLFDRIMIAQAIVDNRFLLTADRDILQYPAAPVLAL